MQKRQYIFLGLTVLLLYLSFKILQHEYQKYMVSNYIKEQSLIIQHINSYLKESNETLNYIETKAFKNKLLKSESSLKMKGEDVVILTSEKIYKKYSGNAIIKNNLNSLNINKRKEKLFLGMSNFEKWIYLLFKKK